MTHNHISDASLATCSHGVSWLDDCEQCALVSAREVVAHYGALVDEARAVIRRSEPKQPIPRSTPRLVYCAASQDGECSHSKCPQLRDGEPMKSGRHCPLDQQQDDD